MATTHEGPAHGHPHSTAKIGTHPIHPMLVPFPIVCFVGTLVVDIVFIRTGNPNWAIASRYLLGVGLIMAALAALSGLTDFFGEKRIQGSDAIKHMLANVVAVVVNLVNFFIRLHSDTAIQSLGVYLSAIVVLILLYSGWKGGDLVYRHGMGVHDTSNL